MRIGAFGSRRFTVQDQSSWPQLSQAMISQCFEVSAAEIVFQNQADFLAESRTLNCSTVASACHTSYTAAGGSLANGVQNAIS